MGKIPPYIPLPFPFLDIVIEEAYEQIGVDMDGTVMSLQLVPQPNHSLLLTISGRR